MQSKTIFAAAAAFALVAGSGLCHAEEKEARNVYVEVPAGKSIGDEEVLKRAGVALAETAKTMTMFGEDSANLVFVQLPPTKLELTEEQTKRYHSVHYHFGHKNIPEFVFKHSVNFRESLDGSDEELEEYFGKYLVELWNGMWGKNPPEPVGLKSEIVGVGIGTNAADVVRGYLITFPEPPQSPDNYFAFVFVDKNHNLRYLTYEKSISFGDGDTQTAVLCGWNPNGSRANYGLSGGVTREQFLSLLKPFLKRESPPISAWNPSGGEVGN